MKRPVNHFTADGNCFLAIAELRGIRTPSQLDEFMRERDARAIRAAAVDNSRAARARARHETPEEFMEQSGVDTESFSSEELERMAAGEQFVRDPSYARVGRSADPQPVYNESLAVMAEQMGYSYEDIAHYQRALVPSHTDRQQVVAQSLRLIADECGYDHDELAAEHARHYPDEATSHNAVNSILAEHAHQFGCTPEELIEYRASLPPRRRRR